MLLLSLESREANSVKISEVRHLATLLYSAAAVIIWILKQNFKHTFSVEKVIKIKKIKQGSHSLE